MEGPINRGIKDDGVWYSVVHARSLHGRNEDTVETHSVIVFIRMLYFLGSNRSPYRGGKYINSALINDIYIQMDKKTRGKCVSALSRGFEARIARNNSLLSFAFYIYIYILPFPPHKHKPLTVLLRDTSSSRKLLFCT